MVFVGTEKGENPRGTWPAIPYITVEKTEKIQEKPFLIYDEKNGYQVFVPEVRENSMGVSWEDGAHGEALLISNFYVVKAGVDTADIMNAALAEGKHLLLTPGIYELSEPIRIEKEGTIVLGMGLATLQSMDGSTCMVTADVGGLIIAGVLFDAGQVMSENLLVVGSDADASVGIVEQEDVIAEPDLNCRDFISMSTRPFGMARMERFICIRAKSLTMCQASLRG